MARGPPWSVIGLLFFLFSSSVLGVSAVIGVDLGTEYIKASLVKPGIPLDIVLTKDSRRKEISAVAFKPVKNAQSGSFPERLYGSDAMALSARFPADVYPNLKMLLGLPFDNSLVKEYSSRHPALKMESDKTRGTTAFRSSTFSKDEQPWTVEEILAMELQNVQKNAEALAGKGSSIKDIVITFPAFYTLEERRSIELAADLAGLRILSMMSDGLAVGLNYASSRTFPSVTSGGKAEHHLVFDMGAGSVKATLMRFQGRTVKDVGKYNKTIQEVQVLGTGWNRTLGGDSINAVIVDDMVAKFVESKGAVSVTPEAVKAHGRASAKLWKEAERIRQVLSANTDAQGSFEGLYEDVDFKYKLSRAEFEKLVEPFAQYVAAPIEKALDAAQLTVADLDSIIVHGGTVRTPFVQRQLEKIAGSVDKIRSNVNSDESAAFGSGLKGADLSPSFRVKDIRTYDVAGYPIGYKWVNLDGKSKHQRLFVHTSTLGAEKQISFKNHKDFTFRFYQHVPSSENVSKGSAEKDVMKVTTKNLTAGVEILMDKYGCSHGDIDVSFGVRLSSFTGEPEITKATVTCEVEDENKGGLVDGMKNMFGFGSKKDAQEPLADPEDPLVKENPSTESTTTATSGTSSERHSTTPSSPDVKAKDSKRLEIINIDFTTENMGIPTLSATEIRRMKDRLDAFSDSDRSRLLREDALNQLEGFTYRVRDILTDDPFIAVSTKAERDALEAKSSATSEWLYGEGISASREELKARLKDMKDIVNPVEFRKKEAASRPEQVAALQSALAQTKVFIDTFKSQMELAEAAKSSASAAESDSSTTAADSDASPPKTGDFDGLEDDDSTTTKTTAPDKSKTSAPTRPLYTMDDLTEIRTLQDSITEWLEKTQAAQDALEPTVDPVLLSAELKLKTTQLTDAGARLVRKTMTQQQQQQQQRIPPKAKSNTKAKAKGAGKGKTAKKGNQAKKKAANKQAAGTTTTTTRDGASASGTDEDQLPSEEELLEAFGGQMFGGGEEEGKGSHDEL